MWPFKPSVKKIRQKYLALCRELGDTLSYAYLGEPCGIDRLIKRWSKSQSDHAVLGFRTLNVGEMISYGGYGKSLEHLVDERDADAEALAFRNIGEVVDYLNMHKSHPMRVWIAEQFHA